MQSAGLFGQQKCKKLFLLMHWHRNEVIVIIINFYGTYIVSHYQNEGQHKIYVEMQFGMSSVFFRRQLV